VLPRQWPLVRIGLFGVVSHSVTRRRQEIGLRIALGAARGEIMRQVLGRAFVLAGLGIAFGVALAIVLSRVMSAVVYGVSVRDPLTFMAAVATIALVPYWAPRFRRAAQRVSTQSGRYGKTDCDFRLGRVENRRRSKPSPAFSHFRRSRPRLVHL